MASEAHEREKLERLCRYITRPAVSTERLSLTAQGNVRYRLKTPYRDGTTEVVFEPLDFMARLAALVPTPRINLRRYHGVFAPNHRLRKREKVPELCLFAYWRKLTTKISHQRLRCLG